MDHNRLGGFLQLIREGRAATERVRIVGDGLQAADRLDRGIGGYDRVATGPQAVGPRVEKEAPTKVTPAGRRMIRLLPEGIVRPSKL